MYDITPEQNGQLKTWAGQRDALLLEVSNLRIEKEKLETQINNLSGAKTFVERETNQLLGRLAELSKKEKETGDLISNEIHNKLIVKTKLESEVTNLQKQIEILNPQKESLKSDIFTLTETFKTISQRSGVLEKVVDHVTKVSEFNVNTFDTLMVSLKKQIEDLISITKKTAGDTDMVMKELPKVFFDVQRASLQKHKING